MKTNSVVKSIVVMMLFATCPVFAQSTCEHRSNVVRVDSENKRLFVIATEDEIATPNKARTFLKPFAKYVLTCQPGWDNHWNVSIFTQPTLALYKSEIESQSASEVERWTNSYIAEYSSQNQKLVIAPLSLHKKRWMRVAMGK
ncbi:MAG TPA: hypothetical protein VHR84_20665 [Terriglobales bacterium]|nr:hypothetical protein [Terriglobales bacterium]